MANSEVDDEDNDEKYNIKLDKQNQLQQQQKFLQTEPWIFCKTNRLQELKTWADKSENKDSLNQGTLRGVFGENPLHVTILYGATTCAKWLLENYPDLRFQQYTAEEYKGETALHLVIAKNNMDIFDIILPPKQSKNIVQRATNEIKDFEDNEEKNSNNNGKNSNYQVQSLLNDNKLKQLINNKATGRFFHRIVDYGEHALTFAVVLNRYEMVNRLLDYGANIDCKSENGNTIFHYCAKQNLVKMFQHLISRKDDLVHLESVIEKRNNNNYTCFQYSVKYKNKEIFEEILKFKEKTIWTYGTVQFVACPLDEIDTHGDNKNSVLETILAENALEFVNLPVIKAILDDKWVSYAKKYFYIWCIVHCLYVLTLYWLYVYYIRNDAIPVVILTITFLKLLVSETQRGVELYDLISEHGKKMGMDIYFQWNIDEFSVIEFFHSLLLISNICIIVLWIAILINNIDVITIFLTIQFVSECLFILYFCQATQSLGILIISTLRVIMGDVRRFLILFVIVSVAFAASIVFTCGGRIDFIRAFVTLFYVSVGAGDYWVNDMDDDYHQLKHWQIIFNEIIYFVFLLVSTVLLFNLLIAIFTQTVTSIHNESKQHWLFSRASIILSIERKVDKFCLRKLLYKRTGEKGEKYGLGNSNIIDDLHYMVFKYNVSTDQTESAKKITHSKPSIKQRKSATIHLAKSRISQMFSKNSDKNISSLEVQNSLNKSDDKMI